MQSPASMDIPGRYRRLRPGDASWPSEADWQALNAQVGGRLVKIEPTLATCSRDPQGAACSEVFRQL